MLDRDFNIGKRLCNLPALAQVGFSANRRLLDVERLTTDPTIGEQAFRTVADPVLVGSQRASALPFDSGPESQPHDPRQNELRRTPTPPARTDRTPARHQPGTHRYIVTDLCLRIAIFLTRVHTRLVRPGLAELLTDHDPQTPLRRQIDRLDTTIDSIARNHRLIA